VVDLMLINNIAGTNELLNSTEKSQGLDTQYDKITSIFSNTPKTLDKATQIKNLLQKFKPLDLEDLKQSLFTLSITIFKEFDPAKGHIVSYRFLSVDKGR